MISCSFGGGVFLALVMAATFCSSAIAGVDSLRRLRVLILPSYSPTDQGVIIPRLVLDDAGAIS